MSMSERIVKRNWKPVLMSIEKPVLTSIEKPVLTSIEKPVLTRNQKPDPQNSSSDPRNHF